MKPTPRLTEDETDLKNNLHNKVVYGMHLFQAA